MEMGSRGYNPIEQSEQGTTMQTQTKIKIDNTDRAHPKNVVNAFGLIGGHKLPDDERKLFSYIFGNDFTFDHVLGAVAVVKRRRDELYATADSEVFTDPKIQKVWGDGLKANADLAVREVTTFLEDLRADLLELNT